MITNYTVIYQGTSGRITKYTSNTSLVIEGLALNGQYTVSVAAVNSQGDMSTFSNASTLITPAPPTQPSTGGNAHDICRRHSSVMNVASLLLLLPIVSAQAVTLLCYLYIDQLPCATCLSGDMCFIYRMHFNFCGVYISRICNFCGFRIFKFAVAGYSGVEIFAGEIFVDTYKE